MPRLVDRIIRESHIIQLDKLVIKEGEKVWTVFIDVYPINDDGNLIDAASLGAVAALKNAKIPMLDKDGKIDYDKDSKESIPLTKDISPLSFSFFKIGDSVILDPTREEEEAADARITFGISKWNGQYVINSCQKSGEEPLTQAEIENMMSVITKKFDEVTQKLKKYI